MAFSDVSQPAKVDKAKDRDERFKRWLAVLIALVALLVTITSWLQADVGNRGAELSRVNQESAVLSTGVRTRGQLESVFANEIVREYDELMDQANSLKHDNRPLEASAFITAAKQMAAQSSLLSATYTRFDDTGWRQSTRSSTHAADTWAVTATLISERREAAAKEGDAWGSKGNSYTSAITTFAVCLFLFALSSTIGGWIRWLFLTVGLGLTGLTFLGVVITTLLPVEHIPDAALQEYARGRGFADQGGYVEAVDAYSRALTLSPTYANALASRGLARLHLPQREIDQAIQDLKAASQRTQKYNVYWNLGWAHYLAGNYAQAIQASQRSLELNSQVCGPAFNIGLARLAMGNPNQAAQDYEAAIARCDKILQGYLAAGLAPPYSLWSEIGSSIEDIEDLLCRTHGFYCYPDRTVHDISRVADKDTILENGLKYRKRLKEAVTALEYMHTSTPKPSGAIFKPLQFVNKFVDDAGDFQAYVIRDRFPYRGPDVFAIWDYANIPPDTETVWKVFLNGTEKSELRYQDPWDLGLMGRAVKRIDSWFVMGAGHYDVEVYGNGELLSTGSFEIDQAETLPSSLPIAARPAAPVNVGKLLLSDDFHNNNHGWWFTSGSSFEGTERAGRIANGEYVIVSHEQDTKWRVTCFDCGNLSDLYYEASTRLVSGPDNYGYGLVVRGDRGMDEMYLFLISGAGAYKIAKVVDGEYRSVTNWIESKLIRPKSTNRVGVLARGSSFEFYINGQLATRAADTSLSKGYIGFTVETEELAVAFSQVRVWQLR